MAYVDLCVKAVNSRITCSKYWSSQVYLNVSGFAVEQITAKIRDNNDPIVVWSYKYTTVAIFLNLNTKKFIYHQVGDIKGFSVSSVAIANDYFIMVSKTGKSF